MVLAFLPNIRLEGICSCALANARAASLTRMLNQSRPAVYPCRRKTPYSESPTRVLARSGGSFQVSLSDHNIVLSMAPVNHLHCVSFRRQGKTYLAPRPTFCLTVFTLVAKPWCVLDHSWPVVFAKMTPRIEAARLCGAPAGAAFCVVRLL